MLEERIRQHRVPSLCTVGRTIVFHDYKVMLDCYSIYCLLALPCKGGPAWILPDLLKDLNLDNLNMGFVPYRHSI